MNYTLFDLFLNAYNGNSFAQLQIVQRFQPLLKKYAALLKYKDAYSDLQLYLLELLHSGKLTKLQRKDDGTLVKYIESSIRHQYISLNSRKNAVDNSVIASVDEIDEVHLNVIKVALVHRLSPKADVLCGFGCFWSLDPCTQQGAQCREHGILCCDAGCKSIVKILRYAVSKLCKAGVFQQQIDHLCIDTPCVEALCGFYGQAKFGNVVVLAVGDVGFSQQKIR